MILKPQDVLILLKLVALDGQPWRQIQLASELGFSQGEVSSGLKRAMAARLLVHDGEHVRPAQSLLLEFLLHGVPYVFIPDRGALTRGMPTAEAAPVFSGLLMPGDDPPPVWPDPDGTIRGESFSPLYPSAPSAARRDAVLYDLLALVDGLRGGKARVRSFARKELKKRLEVG